MKRGVCHTLVTKHEHAILPLFPSESNDSSDWSSSEEEEGIGSVASPLRPSAHAKLTAQWEWRTREEGGEGLASSR